MSSIAAQDPDPESLDTGLINKGKPPRDRWHQMLFVFRAHTAFNSIINSTVNTAQEQSVAISRVLSFRPSYNPLPTHDAGEVSKISSHVSLQINSEGNCSILDIARMVKTKDLASLKKFGGVPGIESALRSHLKSDNLCQSLHNTYCDPHFPEQGFFHFLSKACNDPTIFLLFLCAVLSLGFGIEEEGPKNGWYDGVTTLLAVLILVSTNSVGEWWKARKMKKQSEKKKIICEIIRDGERDGETQKISISEVKVGDIICLTMGDQVPADGLFVDGESLILDDMPDSKIDAQNPFVLSGTEVIQGQGQMLATSVGKNTAWSEMMSQETHAPNKKTPLQAQLEKVNKCIEIIALLASALILVVLFLRYKLGKIDDENGRPEIRGKPTAMNAMQRIIIRPRGPISTLATALVVCLVGLQEGLSFVLTLCIAYWNEKAASNRATVQELLACVNMGLVTIICAEKIGGPIQALKDFTNAGVNIKLVSGDNVAFREIIANECGMLTPNSDRMKIEGEKFRSCTDEEKKEMVDRITVMENANPFDKVLLVRYLRQKGHVVAVVGVGTNDMPALKEADVGLTMGIGSTKMARESSAIIWDGSFEFLVMFSMYGRCVYNNIQKFIQVELTMAIAGLLIISVIVISFGDAPITTIELFWVNLIVAFLGGLALLTEPVTEKIMDKPPVSQAEPLITKAMWRNIVIQVLYQTTILVTFQFEGQAVLGINDRVCKTMIFNSFVLCQVFNKFNAREPEKKNVFKGINQNYLFWVAVGTGVVLQVAFIEIAGIVSFAAKLNFVHWVICFLIGMVSWVIDWAGKCIWYFIKEWIIRPLSSHIGFIRMRSPTPSESASVQLPVINGESMANPSY